MSKEVIITNYKNKQLIAYLENNKVIEMFLKFPDSIEIGDIYIGKVKNIVENIQAAFIEVSPGIIGYYSLKNNTQHLFTRPTQRKLSVGDEIVVQVERGSIKSKAPVLTSRIQIQGEHMVLLANYHFTGISKKIISSSTKENLKKLSERLLENSKHGIIFRTEAQYVSDEELINEFNNIVVYHNNIMLIASKRTCYSKLYGMQNNWLKYVHANNLQDLRIVTDISDVYNDLIQQSQTFKENVICELYSDTSYPLIKLKSLETQIDRAISKNVWLRSGELIVPYCTPYGV